MIVAAATGLMLGDANNTVIVVIAAAFGAYMALNIGANDVANNMGPAVGANAMSMGFAIVVAAIFESAGALIAGGDVVSTIAKGIISPETMATSSMFIAAMLAALLASALCETKSPTDIKPAFRPNEFHKIITSLISCKPKGKSLKVKRQCFKGFSSVIYRLFLGWKNLCGKFPLV